MFGAALKAARFAAIPLFAFLALAAWGLSYPVGASPDEDYHLSSIWCGQGNEQGTCEKGVESDERRVPEALVYSAVCYAFHNDKSASCQDAWFVHESDTLVNTDRGNFKGDYPPVFYATMKTFVGHDISRSVVAMRFANAALFVGLMTLTYWLLPRGRRTMLVLGTTVALVPLGMFLIPSINPSSWAIMSSTVVFAGMVGFFETIGRRRLGLAAIAGLGVLMGVGARADAAVYAALAVVLAAVVSAPWRKDAWKLLPYPVVLGVVCVAGYLSAGQSGAATTEAPHVAAQGFDRYQQVAYNLLNMPSLWAGSFGSAGLGWLDTPMPAIVWVINLATFGAVLYLGIRQTRLRKAAGIAIALAALWLIPTWVLLQSSDLVGVGVQPRYLLPLLPLLAQVALFRMDPHRVEVSRSQLYSVAAALTLTNAIALHYNTRRYVTGTDVFRFNLDNAREWWWAASVPPMVVWFVGSLSFGVALFLCARALMAGDRSAAAPTPAGDVPPAVDRPTPAEDPTPGSRALHEHRALAVQSAV